MIQPMDMRTLTLPETRQHAVILDTETTGLQGEIIELAIADAYTGQSLYDSLLRPLCKVEAGAEAVHHISDRMLIGAPTFEQEWSKIRSVLEGKLIIAYNAQFDHGRFMHTAIAHHVIPPTLKWACAMKAYSNYYGQPNARGFTGPAWHKLNIACHQQQVSLDEASHRAMADVRATSLLLNRVYESYQSGTHRLYVGVTTGARV